MERRFLVYDMRAAGGDTDDATVLCVEDTLKAAVRETRKSFGEGVVYSYAVIDGDNLIDERMEKVVAQ